MPSKPEQVLAAIKTLLEIVPSAKVERNTAVPERIPASGLIVLRDGNPGEPDTALGGFGGVYYSHDVEIELYVEEGGAGPRCRLRCPGAGNRRGIGFRSDPRRSRRALWLQ